MYELKVTICVYAVVVSTLCFIGAIDIVIYTCEIHESLLKELCGVDVRRTDHVFVYWKNHPAKSIP
jgi:hypothetical protein